MASQRASEPTVDRHPATEGQQPTRLNAVQEANLFKMLSIANQIAPGSCAPAQLTQHAARTTQPMGPADFQHFGMMMTTYRKQQLRRQLQQQQQQHQQQSSQEAQQQELVTAGQEHPDGPGQRHVQANALQRHHSQRLGSQSQGMGLQSQGIKVQSQGMGMQPQGSAQTLPNMSRATSLGASGLRQLQHPEDKAGTPQQKSDYQLQRQNYINQSDASAGKLACLGCSLQLSLSFSSTMLNTVGSPAFCCDPKGCVSWCLLEEQFLLLCKTQTCSAIGCVASTTRVITWICCNGTIACGAEGTVQLDLQNMTLLLKEDSTQALGSLQVPTFSCHQLLQPQTPTSHRGMHCKGVCKLVLNSSIRMQRYWLSRSSTDPAARHFRSKQTSPCSQNLGGLHPSLPPCRSIWTCSDCMHCTNILPACISNRVSGW